MQTVYLVCMRRTLMRELWPRHKKRKIRIIYVAGVAAYALVSLVILVTVHLELRMLEQAARPTPVEPFPVSVDPQNKLILENPAIETYVETHALSPRSRSPLARWFDRITERLARSGLYQNLASTLARTLVVYPGERREEVADNFGDILGWTTEERDAFQTLVASSTGELSEGAFFPGRYLTSRSATPETIATLVADRFNAEVAARYTDDVAVRVPLEDALVIASLLEREAYDFTDMREISGIIWNRLFTGMNLQLDATLQYVKGERIRGPWWPSVSPQDKYIDSPFNTYMYEGLPPAPIANPSLEAIVAALNPINTDCIFYFHDADGGFHCSKTYEEHVARLKALYGRGE